MPLNFYLTTDRIQATTVRNRSVVEETLSDSGRIIPSPAFRRLQSKTQVFSLEENAGVRTRLTHSLEVAYLGKTLASNIYTLLEKDHPADFASIDRIAFITAVENACLLHDIGNPPFGHFGEFTLREWFCKKSDEFRTWWSLSPDIFEKYFRGFENFDGNAQGFRIITRLSWSKDQFGLNLTCSLLATYLKYLSSSVNKTKKFGKKIGFFETEIQRVQSVRNSLGIDLENPIRHPLTYIMEAADDLSYCLSDIEDGIEKGIVRWNDIKAHLTKDLGEGSSEKLKILEIIDEVSKSTGEYGEELGHRTCYVNFKISLVRYLMDGARDEYCDDVINITNGMRDRGLLGNISEYGKILGSLKKFAKDKLFSSKEAVDIELAANSIIQGLLNSFLPIFKCSTTMFERLIPESLTPFDYGENELERRLVLLLPRRHMQSYHWQVKEGLHPEPVLRAHLIVDYISGMTDHHALEVFQLLNGISVSVRS